MKYHLKSKSFIIGYDDFNSVGFLLMFTMHQIRLSAGIPLMALEENPLPGPMTPIDHALMSQMELAKSLGIDLGCERWWQLDVTRTD